LASSASAQSAVCVREDAATLVTDEQLARACRDSVRSSHWTACVGQEHEGRTITADALQRAYDATCVTRSTPAADAEEADALLRAVVGRTASPTPIGNLTNRWYEIDSAWARDCRLEALTEPSTLQPPPFEAPFCRADLGADLFACADRMPEGVARLTATRDALCTRSDFESADLQSLMQYLTANRILVPWTTQIGAASPPAADDAPPEGREVLAAGVAAPVVAGAVAEFLVGRAEEELSVFATEEIWSRLCGRDDTRWAFEAVCAVTANDDGDGGSVATTPPLGVVRRAIREDLDLFATRLVGRIATAVPETAQPAYCVMEALTHRLTAIVMNDELGAWAPSPDCTDTAAAVGVLFDPSSTWTQAAEAILALVRAHVPDATQVLDEDEAKAVVRSLAELRSVAQQLRALASNAADYAQSVARLRREAFSAVFATLSTLREPLATALRLDAEHLAKWTTAIERIGRRLLERDYAGAVLLALRTLATADPVPRSVAQLIALAADVAEAEDASDVTAALDAIAEPVGSWRRKHDTAGISLTGMVGIEGSFELGLADANDPVRDGFGFAPKLAIGVDFHFPIPDGDFRVSLFVPIVDVGNVVSVRFADLGSDSVAETEVLPDVTYAQLFSPGLYATLGLGRTPLVVGLGASYVPALRTAEGSDTRTSVLRFGLFLAVDTTLLSLH
jgi:hypothetical protein